MDSKKPKIIIVGAGPGGLSAGMLLAHRGFAVEIFEKAAQPGGRNGSLQLGEYKFDIGPTFFMMDFVLRDIFRQSGRDLEKSLSLIKLSPMYRLFFADQQIDIHDDENKMAAELKRVFPGDEIGLKKFMAKEKLRFLKLFKILSRDNNNILRAASPDFLSALPAFSIGRSLYDALGDYFKHEYARLSFTFQAKYLGMSPWECPAAFSMVPYVEHFFGIYHIRGGLSETAVVMARAIEEDGGKIHYNSEVKELILEAKKVIGVELVTGEKILADRVIVNADFSYAMNNLLPAGTLKKYTPAK
jgi:phytoene desaturase